MLISVLFTNSSEYKIVEHNKSFPTVPQTYNVETKPGDLLELVNDTWLSILGVLGTNNIMIIIPKMNRHTQEINSHKQLFRAAE